MLALATLPQAWSILRTRDVAAFGWMFAALNLGGISFLAMRSWEIREFAFLGINIVTAAFWLLVLMLKITTHRATRAPPSEAASSTR